jgi:ribonucleoside-diphosphate reductase alpha subunit
MSIQEYEDEQMFVINRLGKEEPLDVNKIVSRIKSLLNREPKIENLNAYEVMGRVTEKLTNRIPTYIIDDYIASLCASASISNPYYGKLANRIAVDNHQKNTRRSFTDKMKEAYLNKFDNEYYPLVSSQFIKYVEEHQEFIESIIDYKRDFLIDYFGLETFKYMYSLKKINNDNDNDNKINDSKTNGKTNNSNDKKYIERIQDMFMRVAIEIHYNVHSDINEELNHIKETYDALSNKYISHASPTYFNSGTPRNQLASCYLLGLNDNRESIMHVADSMSAISKWGGGIGINVSEIRPFGSLIKSTRGKTKGIYNWLSIYNNVMKGFDQGGMRQGSAAVYIEMHHPDIMSFLRMRIPETEEYSKSGDLFPALWVSDLFMERVKKNELWSLFDPSKYCDLSNYYGDEYNKKYLELEQKQLFVKQISAREIWEQVFYSNRLSGLPYICFKDHINKYSNQSNIGIIKNSNLCSEIMEFSNNDEYAVCVLASLSLSICVIDTYSENEDKTRILNHEFPVNPKFDFNLLIKNTHLLVRNLNNIIDKNYYPTIETERSNLRHRPIGIGVQGLNDAYMKMRYSFESEEAAKLNKLIFETIDYASTSMSSKLAKEKYNQYVNECKLNGSVKIKTYVKDHYEPVYLEFKDYKEIPKNIGSYPSMNFNGGSKISKGIFQWQEYKSKISTLYDWETVSEYVKIFGIRNSLRLAIMPTASTSQLLGNNECIEPMTSNIYKRRTIAGQFVIINKYLINDLYRLNIWNDTIKDYLLHLEGSIQSIEGIPDEIKKLYKTSWEIPQSILIQHSIDRQPFIDQGQSLNLYVQDLKLPEFTNLMFQAWKGNLKTGKYYIHTRPAVMPQKFTIDPQKQKQMEEILNNEKNKINVSFMENIKEDCLLCSS